ncbi:MAG: acyl-CoA/acyl-ACP dehydrogenase [Hyphomonadaceae bacterium]|nr:acyl-CoA/acyl-ACP dehydrogenase [Hyphomonadaceae bacterium]
MAIDFDLSDAQRAFQDAVGGYLAETCTPRQVLATFKDALLAERVWRGACELGLPGVVTPAAYGGLGLGFLDASIIAEVMGRYGAPCGLAEHWLASACLASAAHDDLRKKWLPRLATGAARATLSFAEDDDRWGPEEWRDSGAHTLTAIRPHTPWPAAADIIIVGLAGGRLGLIETEAGGVTAELSGALDATRPLAKVSFSNAPLHILADSDALARRLRDLWLTLLAADACGGASHCLDATVAYVKERKQFGVPVGQFQGVKHQLADLAVKVAPACALYWYAAHALDLDLPDASVAAAQAKAHCSELYVDAARKAIELHGGIGYTWEYGLHIWLRRSLHDRQFLGAPRKHRARIADLKGW